MIMLPSKVSKQHSIGDGGFQLGHHQANLPVQELRAVQVLVPPQNLFVPMGDLYANTTTIAFCHIVTLDHGIKTTQPLSSLEALL